MVKSDYKYISGSNLIKMLKLKYDDFKYISQKGSHIKIEVNGIKAIIPNHKQLAYGTFSAILRQLKIDENDFLKN